MSSTTDTTTDRLAALEQRLAALEDQMAIAQMIAAYGPLVDAGAAEDVGAMWTEDGVYDVESRYMGDRAAIVDMVNGTAHQTLIGGGACHFLGPATVTVDGDTAVAVCDSLLVRHQDGAFTPIRATAHHWELVRTDTGWETTRRTSRLLDGSEEARALLAAGARGERRG